MRRIFFLVCMCLGTMPAIAQGPMNVWWFGSNAGVVFNGTAPVTYPMNPMGQFRTTQGCASVCNSAGALLFATNGYWVYDRNNQRMPSFSGSTVNMFSPIIAYTGGNAIQTAVIAPFAEDTGRFYVFSLSTTGQLYYTVVDMRLNNGLGDVVPGQKGIFLAGNLWEKMSIVAGCNNRWLVVRSRSTNEWLSFSITSSGINHNPVKSQCGLLSLKEYHLGVIKFSPDGKKMAAACHTNSPGYNGGLELYNFDPFNGKLYNPVLLDSITPMYGACFSPDNTKLYVSHIIYGNVAGKVYQYDLSQSTVPAVIASRTLVLTNPTYWRYDGICGCWQQVWHSFGDLQRGPDGKIYIGNDIADQKYFQSGPNITYQCPAGCAGGINVNYGSHVGPMHYLHVINRPDLPGLASQPQIHAVFTGGRTFSGLPNDIVFHPVQDTVRKHHKVAACFRDSITLLADTGKEYRWNDGTDTRSLMVRQDGVYIVHFTDISCNYRIDTFSVTFNRYLPSFAGKGYSCPGAKQGQLVMLPYKGDTSSFTYQWYETNGETLHTRQSRDGDTITGLNPGRYAIQITTPAGCDTILYTEVLPLPMPAASFEADTIACKNKPVYFRNTSETLLWQWYFGDGMETDGADPVHSYTEAGLYMASLVVENLERCTDTAYKTIQVDELKLRLISDKQTVNRNERILLQTNASVPYHITAWQPEHLFTDQQAYRQQLTADTTRIFTVAGISEHGCVDTATVTVTVHPFVYLPTAFTPNGDGRNDYFRPSVSGAPVVIRNFQIFDRWGREIWSGWGSSTTIGWDGTYNGTPAEVGTYFYRIETETHTGKTFIQKGDVTLVR
jgi:gliding motility-associated-like protein